MEAWIIFVAGRSAELWARTGEHLILTGVSTIGAILFGIPLGIIASKVRSIRDSLTGLVGIVQTIPSLAMLAILLALTGQIGVAPAIIALTLYALLPIVRNTLTGIEQVPQVSLEAARGVGMTGRQTLFLVELPLALPTIIAGVRTAAVVAVGIATLSAFIGAGGLGEFINRGLALSSTKLILLGAIPAALLALIVDGSIAALQWGLQVRPGPSGRHTGSRKILRPVALALPILLCGVGVFAAVASGSRGSAAGDTGERTIRIASKNFTEQLILGEMLAQMVEGKTDLVVERRFNLGGTMICHEALVQGEMDLYVEYVGTALTAVLQRDASVSADDAFREVKRAYETRFDCTWMRPLGFENTYALAVSESFAGQHDLHSVSQLAPISDDLRAGFTSEFMERPDGYPGLRNAYHLNFSSVKDLDPALMYQALAEGQLDVISAFSTDGRIPAYHLKTLEDDKGFFPPYFAAVVVRLSALETHQELRQVLQQLSGTIETETMQQLNYEVDEKKRSPKAVAGDFLTEQGLLD